MEPAIHHSNNTVFNPPKGDAECQSLSATRATVLGRESVITFWKPNGEELKQLNEGRSVAVILYTPIIPPMWVVVDDSKLGFPQ